MYVTFFRKSIKPWLLTDGIFETGAMFPMLGKNLCYIQSYKQTALTAPHTHGFFLKGGSSKVIRQLSANAYDKLASRLFMCYIYFCTLHLPVQCFTYKLLLSSLQNTKSHQIQQLNSVAYMTEFQQNSGRNYE